MERGQWGEMPAAWWAPALALHERLDGGSGRSEAVDSGSAAADERVARWRAAYPGLTGDTLVLQAEGLGVSVADVEHSLAASPIGVGKPEWARLTEQILQRRSAARTAATSADRRWQDGFASILSPFLEHAASAAASTPPAVRAAFRAHVAERLIAVASRTFVLRLHEMRAAGRLIGETPQDRFWSFVEILCSRAELCELLTRYPVLARLLTRVSGQAADAFAEFLGRLDADHAPAGPLAEVAFGAGDSHDGGRSVLLLRFQSGERLVYKPRPLAVHEHFNVALTWFGNRVPEAAPRPLRVVDRGAYGWVEFVEPAPCADTAAAGHYFFRLGAQLALLYALSGTDFHYENVIAVGDQPVLLDLESLLHVGLPVSTGFRSVDTDPAVEALDTSVARIGLLPAVIGGALGGAVDVGGLGGDAGALSPYRSPSWEDAGTDRMRMVRVHRPMPKGHNRVLIDGRPAEPAQYADQICAGFRTGYRAIAEHRDELRALLSRFEDDELRVIVRPTRTYARLLDETTHPDVLADALDRDRVLGILWALADGDPDRRQLAAAEARDLWNADVPLLRTRAGSRDIRASDGTIAADLLPESGLARALRVIAAMDDADLERQEWVVRATVATRAAAPVHLRRPSTASAGTNSADTDADPRELALTLARQTADRVAAMALTAENRLSWLGLELEVGGPEPGADQWQVRPAGRDLFGGSAGIGLFFAQLAKVTGEQEYATFAMHALQPLHAYVDELLEKPALRPHPGAFSGDAGIAYALAGASVLLGEPALADPVGVLLGALTESVETDADLDVIGGAAGCLAVAEALAPRFPETEELAAACVRVLINGAVAMPDGVAWHTPVTTDRPLTGFSHGAGGIAWALARHVARTADETALRTAWAGFAYERAAYGTPSMHAWCHGAPGIGLARAGVDPVLRTPDQDDDLRLALVATTEFGLFGNHSLCHGDLGNLELFTAALGTSSLAAAEHPSRTRRILADLAAGGPLCGTPAGLPTPGLMTGLAGIGHGLLRIAAPETVASVLLLQEQR